MCSSDLPEDAGEIADPIAIAVLEGARIDLIDDRALPPRVDQWGVDPWGVDQWGVDPWGVDPWGRPLGGAAIVHAGSDALGEPDGVARARLDGLSEDWVGHRLLGAMGKPGVAMLELLGAEAVDGALQLGFAGR